MSRSLPRPFASLLVLVLALPCGAQRTGESQLNQHGPSGNASGLSTPSKQFTKTSALLPPSFGGQPRDGAVLTVPTPADTDFAHAAVLKEDGLVEANSARYGNAMEEEYTLEVLRFADATGAFAAFTFYRDPTAQPEALGQNAVATSSAVLAQQSNILLVGRRISGTAPIAGLRASTIVLLPGLPKASGPEGVLPTLPALLPADGLQKQTVHYAIGPAGYNGPLPVSTIPFSKDAEVATAAYRLRSGAEAILTLIMVPTPQIAGPTLRTITSLGNPALHLAARRIGPLVAVVSGQGVAQADAQRLVNGITYVADVTLDQPQGYTSEVAKAAKLLAGIGYLTVFIAIAALVVAVFFGVGRALIRRLRGKPASSVSDDEFITLKL